MDDKDDEEEEESEKPVLKPSGVFGVSFKSRGT